MTIIITYNNYSNNNSTGVHCVVYIFFCTFNRVERALSLRVTLGHVASATPSRERLFIFCGPQAFRESGLTAVDFMKIKGISKMTKCASGTLHSHSSLDVRRPSLGHMLLAPNDC